MHHVPLFEGVRREHKENIEGSLKVTIKGEVLELRGAPDTRDQVQRLEVHSSVQGPDPK